MRIIADQLSCGHYTKRALLAVDNSWQYLIAVSTERMTPSESSQMTEKGKTFPPTIFAIIGIAQTDECKAYRAEYDAEMAETAKTIRRQGARHKRDVLSQKSIRRPHAARAHRARDPTGQPPVSAGDRPMPPAVRLVAFAP